MELRCGERERFDSADDESDDDGDEGDGEVVVELADGLDEGPAVSAEHEDVVRSVNEGHAGGEEDGEDKDGAEGKSARGFGGGDADEADFGGGVKAKAEENSERIHVPTAADEREHGPEEAGEKSAIGEEKIEVLIDIGLAGADAGEGAIDGDEHDDVDDGDGEQEETRNEGADEAADGAGRVHSVLKSERGGGDDDRADDDDGGVAEREHEADSDGALALLHELAGDVVDGGDVVRVDRVAEAEAVGEQGGAEQEREVAEGDDGPEPCSGVENKEQAIDADDFVAKISGGVVKEREQAGTRRVGCADGRRREWAGGIHRSFQG